MRLIDADALSYEILSEYGADGGTKDVNTIYGMVINAPTIDAEPVKHGEWQVTDYMGGNYFSDMLQPSKSFIIWDKRCNNNMVNDFADCEYAWMSNGMGVARIFRYVWNGMIQGNMKNKEQRFHPTQKPVALYKWILQNYAKPGDKILDTHVGSASSLIACYDLGYQYVGFEIDKEYYELASKRLADEMAQLRMEL